MKKSLFAFGLLSSSLVMFGVMLLFNNNAAFAQAYDTYGDSSYDSSYSKYPTEVNKYECRVAHLKASLYLQ